MTNPRVQSDGKLISNAGTNRSITTLVTLSSPEFIDSESSVTQISVEYKNNNSVAVEMDIAITETQEGPNEGQLQIPAGETRTYLFSGLDPNTQYTFSARFLPGTGVAGFAQSGFTTNTVSTTQATTSTPGTAGISSTTNTVTYRIRNTDPIAGTASWLIRQGTTSGTIRQNSSAAIGPSGNTSTRDVFPTLSGRPEGTTF